MYILTPIPNKIKSMQQHIKKKSMIIIKKRRFLVNGVWWTWLHHLQPLKPKGETTREHQTKQRWLTTLSSLPFFLKTKQDHSPHFLYSFFFTLGKPSTLKRKPFFLLFQLAKLEPKKTPPLLPHRRPFLPTLEPSLPWPFIGPREGPFTRLKVGRNRLGRLGRGKQVGNWVHRWS